MFYVLIILGRRKNSTCVLHVMEIRHAGENSPDPAKDECSILVSDQAANSILLSIDNDQ